MTKKRRYLPRRPSAVGSVLLLALLCLPALPAAADAPPPATIQPHPPASARAVSLEVTTRTGVQYGQAKELVYAGEHTLSELLWPFEPVLYTGSALSLETRFGLCASLDVRAAFPRRSGYMQDSDFKNYESGDFSKTHYSRHDCYTERAIALDTRVGWTFRPGARFLLQPFAAFGLMQYKWTARDGYLQYPPELIPPYTPWSPSGTKVPVSGTTIVYEQTYLIPSAGLSTGMRLGRRFDAGLSFAFSPFVFCNDLDNHVQATFPADYYDRMSWGLLLEPSVTLGYRLNPRARLSLGVSYRRISGLVGDITEVSAGVGETPGEVAATFPGGAGASYDALDASLALSLSL
jgi:outer membrane protease